MEPPDPVLLAGVTVVLGAALIFGLFLRQRAAYGKHVAQLQPKAQPKKREMGVYTRAEVAEHSTRRDAWIIVQDKKTKEDRVYDVTDYVDDHPGGESILRNAGGDATEGFLGPQHPSTVNIMLDDMCIGKLAG